MDAVDDLSDQLWTMRELLEQLVYKLEVQRLLLNSGQARWLPFVGAELEALVTAITEVELARQHASRRVAARLGLAPDTTLDELVDRVGAPWSDVLRTHRLHLLSLHGQVEDASHNNHELARHGVARTKDLLAALTEETVDVYDPGGMPVSLSLASKRLDRTV